MNPHRRILVAALAAAPFALAPFGALAQERPQYTELKPPQPTESGGKIEVIEFFWYGCPHCYNLEPTLEAWAKKLPADVALRLIPAVFNERWAYDAAIFYTFDALGVLERVHRPFFDAIHRDRLRTDNPAALSEWLGKNGIDPKKFQETFKSFGVQSKTRRATQQTVAYKIDGTPAMAVQGRFTVSAEQGRTQQGLLQTVDYLVDLVRRNKS
ncbi:MAG TPA: thiol:disulfide interchange protein DsbA/DsbL [Burkholderiales bacterium]|nr:thiol:disulfide interchange protein DsbA/DsbL [Burkholderiales bacterium]